MWKIKKKCMPFFIQRILLLVIHDALMSFWPLFQFHRLFLIAAYKPPFRYHTVTLWTLNYGTFVKYYKRLSIVIVLNGSCSRLLFFLEENSDCIKSTVFIKTSARPVLSFPVSRVHNSFLVSRAHNSFLASRTHNSPCVSCLHNSLPVSPTHDLVVILILKFHSVNKL